MGASVPLVQVEAQARKLARGRVETAALGCLAEQRSADLLFCGKTAVELRSTWTTEGGCPLVTGGALCTRTGRLGAHLLHWPMPPPVVLTIAGFDPSSGAGVTADIKTIAAHGCYGVGCATALTVQSTAGVRRVETISPELVTETLEELRADLEISAVHIGMLGSGKIVRAVADFLEKAKLGNVVLDPIIKSSSGRDLIDASGVRLLIERLLPLVGVITPNVDEAASLTGLPVTDLEQMRVAVARLHEMGAASVVITGGHLEKAIDLLSFASRTGPQQEVFKSTKLPSNSTHGTGCAFSTAMACHLAQGRGLPEAVLLAKTYVAAAIANAYPLGRGVGPVHHLYRMYQQRRVATHEGA